MADNQPRDDHAKQLKQTISTVKQLRGWVSSDPTRTEEFVDALNLATGLRLLSRAWNEAAPEAAEAVGASDKLVASRGPVGPYTPLVDAGRYFTALTHVATVQVGMDLPESAGKTIGAAFAWKDQLTRDGLADELLPRTAVWALLATSRAALARGDLSEANARADAALRRAREANFEGDELPVLLDALQADADARYSVGLVDQSIGLLQEAVGLWKQWTVKDLEQLPRMAKPHLERLVSPVFSLRRDLADRLAAAGRLDEAVQVREELATLMHRTAARRGEPGRVDLARARADQAWTLVDAGRAQEALRAGEDALQALQSLFKLEKPVGAHLPTQLLVAPALARAELAAGRPQRAQVAIDSLFNRLQAHPGIATDAAARGLALLVRADVQEAQEDAAAAAQSRAAAQQVLTDLRAGESEPHHHSETDAMTYLRSRARGVVLPSQQPTPYWEVPDAAGSLTPSTARSLGEPQLSDEEAMRRIDEARQAEARERAAEEERQAAERARKEQEAAAQRAAAREEYERRQAELRAAQEAVEAEQRAQEAVAEARPAANQELDAGAAAPESHEVEAVEAAQAALAAAEAERQAREQAERAAAERAQAELEEAERMEAEARRIDEEAARQEAERVEAERRRLEQEQAEQAAREEREAQAARLEAERRAAEQAERASEARAVVDPLADLREQAAAALASGNKDRVVHTHERLAEALEARAHTDPQVLGRELVTTLERLSEAQGWWGGRAAGKRAKQLSKQWGL